MKRHMLSARTFTRFAVIPLVAGAMFQAGSVRCDAGAPSCASHPPMRPLPAASTRPLPGGPTYFVHAEEGDDEHPGTRDAPWKTIARALEQLRPGDTLCLRGGIYYEPCEIAARGTDDKPITIRGFPGELAVIDAGLREFHDSPETAWQPAREGSADEYVSSSSYPGLEKVFGNFADSMVPLHGYRNRNDLRSGNEYWGGGGKLEKDWSIYCGPGVWYNQGTGRIYCRLAHTKLAVLGPDNYRGETDPRKLRLVVTAAPDALHVRLAQHLRIQDLVLRGARKSALSIEHSQDVVVDNVTAYGSDPVVNLRGCRNVRLERCRFRGIAAPWSFRSSHKYRGTAAYLLTARGDDAPNREIEIAHCELTDSHDGPFLGTIRGLQFHHNRVDNFNDDGVYLTAMSVGGDVFIHQNVISRCLHAFSFFGEYPVGGGVWIYRNVIDLRAPVHYFQPDGDKDERFTPQGEGQRHRFPSAGRLCGDHGGPVWEPIRFYQNTVVARDPAFRDYYGLGWGGHLKDTQRWVYNNIFVQTEGWPGVAIVDDLALRAGGNLHFGLQGERRPAGAHGPPQSDVFADPRLAGLVANWRQPADARLGPGSPALDGGTAIPDEWPDPFRGEDAGPPDMGALPHGVAPNRIGPLAGEGAPPAGASRKTPPFGDTFSNVR